MKRSIVFILLFLVAGWQAAIAQAISGRVVDQQGKALPYVTCVLRSVTDSAYLAGTVTQAERKRTEHSASPSPRRNACCIFP